MKPRGQDEDAPFIDDPENLFFNFTLHFFYRLNRSVAISDSSEFAEIKSLYQRKYKNVFVVHGWQNAWPRDGWMDVSDFLLTTLRLWFED